MAAGFLFDNTCYLTLAAATSAHWSKDPSAILPGTTSYLTENVFNGTVWQIKRYTLSSTGTLTLNTTTSLPALTFETCQTQEKFIDGMTIGWGVAAAMAVSWALMQMRKGV